MNRLDYIKQNELGFEGDTIARDKFKLIIESNKINRVIETGTFLGNTTKHFAYWVDSVYTIEVNKDNFTKAKNNLATFANVESIFGNSAKELDILLKSLYPVRNGKFRGIKTPKVFFFLDAHWESYNPLLEELNVISKYDIDPFIAIHDFKVPNHPELGFDSYAGQDYDFDWIKKGVESIYGTEYKVEYNSEATGAKRGVIYLSGK